MRRLLCVAAIAASTCVFGLEGEAGASSHREAPFVTKNPKVDSTDFYMFNSYQTGRTGYVTILANYLPLQDAYGGPNYFELDPEALYEIHIDNNGDGVEDVTFQFTFKHALNGANGLTLPITLDGTTKTNAVPLLNIGGISASGTPGPTANLHVLETYDLAVVRGDRRTGQSTSIATNRTKPVDFIGTTTFGSKAGYDAYAASHIHDVTIPGCTTGAAKVFVGQRREGFAANIGIIFDLIQSPSIPGVVTGGGTPTGRGFNSANPFDTGLLYNKNVTTLALEVHKDCLLAAGAGASTIIGGWTSASMRQARVLNPGASYTVPSKEGGAWTQVSRLGMPLVNEVVVGIKDKDNYGVSAPKDTAKFADYVTHPTLPALIEVLYGAASPAVRAPGKTRTDLVGVFATGLTVKKTDDTDFNINQTSKGPGNPGPAGNALPEALAEMLRLNTAIPPTSKSDQQAKGPGSNGTSRGLGALGCFTADRKLDTSLASCDPAGFPNGRRPGDDVLDIALRVVMGALFGNDTDAPGRNVPFTDANFQGPEQFDDTFPYLRTPVPGNIGLAPAQP